MKQLFVLLSLSFGTCLVSAQNTTPYFQQEVNYRIQASLDDVNQILTADIEFEYVNNSPNSLSEIWVHLWGNAFKNKRSAFCKQKLRDGNAKFYFAETPELGGYKKLNFTTNGEKINWKFDPKNPDIAVLSLPKPLATGERIRISTPFQLKIPASFSRLGHVETSYQMTQWYPKPAVYDQKGWHAMPYLDMGEFYSEFGSFDVTLTLPENYVVGATGTLQTPAELAFLHQKEVESRAFLAKNTSFNDNEYPASSATMKTIRYTAEKVHDFALFADKRFLVLKDTARLASGKTVDCWAMFPGTKQRKEVNRQLWQNGAFYIRRAIEFYSTKVGEYPYPQATAVHSALSAGGGMEYPMVTVIGNASSAEDLDDVITHEVGHNWFYGILASNEREHPFMDEGLNSYYETRYMKEYYEHHSPFELPKFILDEKKQGSTNEIGYLVLAREMEDTPPDTHSNAFTPIAYGLEVYMKTAYCMHWLEQSVGTAKFDLAMQDYYQKWQFKHPYPEDLQAVLAQNGLDTKWFFQALQTQKQVDYALKSVKPASAIQDSDEHHDKINGWRLGIQNRGKLNAPFAVTAFKNGQALETRWFSVEDWEPRHQVFFPIDSADAFEVDYQRKTLDLNRKNNFRRTSGAFPGLRPFEFRPLSIVQNSRRNTIAVLPWAGWNFYDKTMLGLMLYNAPVPARKFQYYLLPGYALGSKRFTGLADLRFNWFPGGFVRKIILGAGARTFDLDYNTRDRYYTKYYKVVPQVTFELRSPSLSFQHSLNFRTLFLGQENDLRDTAGVYLGKIWQKNTIHELQYVAEQRGLPNPYRLKVTLETQDYRDVFDRPANYLRSTVEWRQKFYYQEKTKVTMRLFAGYFLQSTQRQRNVEPSSLSLNPQGFNDYKYDEVFLARSGAENLLGRQVSQTEGGFKSAFGSAYAGTLGNSNNFICSMNLKADLPVRLPYGIPIKPYFDLGYFEDASPLGSDRPRSEKMLWSGGLMLEFFKGGLEFYFPLVNCKVLKDRYCEQAGGTNPSAIFCGGDYRKIISWSMNLHYSDPVKLVEGMVR